MVVLTPSPLRYTTDAEGFVAYTAPREVEEIQPEVRGSLSSVGETL